jgi:hypothetical protein
MMVYIGAKQTKCFLNYGFIIILLWQSDCGLKTTTQTSLTNSYI